MVRPGDVLALKGGLAAGKTTITKGIARGMGISEDVTSPTYTIISEYLGRIPLYHMDAYRLSGDEDFLNLGAEDFLYGNGVCVIEWSERVAESIPHDAVRIEIQALDDGRRRILLDASRFEEALR